MTEFGDRVKAYRMQHNLTQAETAMRLFPVTHGTTTKGAQTSFICGIETGRAMMYESSPDFEHVMKTLVIDEQTLLKMLHAGQKEVRARQRTKRATTRAKQRAVIAAPVKPIAKPITKPKAYSPKPAVSHVDEVPDREAMSLEALAGDLSVLFQKRSQSPQIRAVHHETLSNFVRKVINTASRVQGSFS